MTKQRCHVCGELQPLEMFWVQTTTMDGTEIRRNSCSDCTGTTGLTNSIANCRRLLAQFGLTKQIVWRIRLRVEWPDLEAPPVPFMEG